MGGKGQGREGEEQALQACLCSCLFVSLCECMGGGVIDIPKSMKTLPKI